MMFEYSFRTTWLLTLSLVTVLTVVGSQAFGQITVSFLSNTQDGGGAGLGNPVTYVGSDPDTDPPIPVVITINIDSSGVASAASITSNNTSVTDEFTVAGTATNGFDSSFILTMWADQGDIAQRVPIRHQGNGGGIGANGGNAFKIDRNDPSGSGVEHINVEFDLTDSTLSSFDAQLTQVGFGQTNGLQDLEGNPIEPDLLLDVDGTLVLFEDVHEASSASKTRDIDPSAGALLNGGMTDLLRISQGEVKTPPHFGFKLETISFDFIPSVGIDGDFDDDDDVDGLDFLIWQRGDSPRGPLNATDLADWEANYGQPSSLANVASVPEPTSAILLCFAISGGVVLSRRLRYGQLH